MAGRSIDRALLYFPAGIAIKRKAIEFRGQRMSQSLVKQKLQRAMLAVSRLATDNLVGWSTASAMYYEVLTAGSDEFKNKHADEIKEIERKLGEAIANQRKLHVTTLVTSIDEMFSHQTLEDAHVQICIRSVSAVLGKIPDMTKLLPTLEGVALTAPFKELHTRLHTLRKIFPARAFIQLNTGAEPRPEIIVSIVQLITEPSPFPEISWEDRVAPVCDPIVAYACSSILGMLDFVFGQAQNHISLPSPTSLMNLLAWDPRSHQTPAGLVAMRPLDAGHWSKQFTWARHIMLEPRLLECLLSRLRNDNIISLVFPAALCLWEHMVPCIRSITGIAMNAGNYMQSPELVIDGDATALCNQVEEK